MVVLVSSIPFSRTIAHWSLPVHNFSYASSYLRIVFGIEEACQCRILELSFTKQCRGRYHGVIRAKECLELSEIWGKTLELVLLFGTIHWFSDSSFRPHNQNSVCLVESVHQQHPLHLVHLLEDRSCFRIACSLCQAPPSSGLGSIHLTRAESHDLQGDY